MEALNQRLRGRPGWTGYHTPPDEPGEPGWTRTMRSNGPSIFFIFYGGNASQEARWVEGSYVG
ncbi:hypothetical protein BofuT4_P061910.1 [Botrytis cinerea T4]|uniref:Uncharacterized protein n=1 Tax=Botryotinia fuckeliana (strain T4) TaxID=999810 RepID=G2XU11_BOTF4|nr:hypothetical protein BofuT4_P061910.1 [Botrytis cinerea T4]